MGQEGGVPFRISSNVQPACIPILTMPVVKQLAGISSSCMVCVMVFKKWPPTLDITPLRGGVNVPHSFKLDLWLLQPIECNGSQALWLPTPSSPSSLRICILRLSILQPNCCTARNSNHMERPYVHTLVDNPNWIQLCSHPSSVTKHMSEEMSRWSQLSAGTETSHPHCDMSKSLTHGIWEHNKIIFVFCH